MAKKNKLEVGNPLGKWVKFHCIRFVPFLEGVANFKFIFHSHFCTNFERFGAYPAAFMLNFPKHQLFPFLMDFRGVMVISTKMPVFLDTVDGYR